jgi:hypothetical protein
MIGDALEHQEHKLIRWSFESHKDGKSNGLERQDGKLG